MGAEDFLDLVDEKGNIIGHEERKIVHKKGLLHREVHIWLYTPKGELVFQMRSPTKETYPNLLDASIGGHVDTGEEWLESAVKEAREEAGLIVKPDDLTFIEQHRVNVFDPVTKMTNNNLRNNYALAFNGDIGDLRIEEGEITDFELWPIDKLFELNDEEAERFIPSLLEEESKHMYRKIQNLANRE
jgi:isopentenyldiphosphate isomerase